MAQQLANRRKNPIIIDNFEKVLQLINKNVLIIFKIVYTYLVIMTEIVEFHWKNTILFWSLQNTYKYIAIWKKKWLIKFKRGLLNLNFIFHYFYIIFYYCQFHYSFLPQLMETLMHNVQFLNGTINTNTTTIIFMVWIVENISKFL